MPLGPLDVGARIVDVGGDWSYEWTLDATEVSPDRKTVTVTMSHGKRTVTRTAPYGETVYVRR